VDQEEILKYMEENGIGTELSMFYKAYSVVYIRQRKFSLANDWALAGKRKGAKPEHKMNEYMKEFEVNMKERLHRDFYSQGKHLSDDDLIDVPVLNNSQKENSNLLGVLDDNLDVQSFESYLRQDNLKRKCPYSSMPQENIKKVRLNDLVNSVKMGEFNIYVDQECREAIPESTKLVNEYDALCFKYNFSLTPVHAEGRFTSWVSQQMPKSELSISLDASITTNTSFSFQKVTFIHFFANFYFRMTAILILTLY